MKVWTGRLILAVLLVTVAGLTLLAGKAPAGAVASSRPVGPDATIRSFYALVNHARYRRAYGLLVPLPYRKYAYARFLGYYKGQRKLELRLSKPVAPIGAMGALYTCVSVRVTVLTLARQVEPYAGWYLLRRRRYGVWRMVVPGSDLEPHKPFYRLSRADCAAVAPPNAVLRTQPCRSPQLRLAAQLQGAGGQRVGEAILSNHSRRSCTLRGRPGIALMDRTGYPLAVRRIRAATNRELNVFETRRGRPVLVPPAYQAAVSLAWGNWCGGTIRYPITLRLKLRDHGGVLHLRLGRGRRSVGLPSGPPPCGASASGSDVSVTRFYPVNL